jgi:hypothetical protein
MVLGPSKEFTILVSDGQMITAPPRWAMLSVERHRLEAVT